MDLYFTYVLNQYKYDFFGFIMYIVSFYLMHVWPSDEVVTTLNLL